MVNNSRSAANLKRKFDRDDAQARNEAINLLLDSPYGRRFLWLWLSELGVFASPFSTDALDMARRCGEHNAGLRLLNSIVETNPTAYTKLAEENAREQAQRKSRADDIRNRDQREHTSAGYGYDFDEPLE